MLLCDSGVRDGSVFNLYSAGSRRVSYGNCEHAVCAYGYFLQAFPEKRIRFGLHVNKTKKGICILSGKQNGRSEQLEKVAQALLLYWGFRGVFVSQHSLCLRDEIACGRSLLLSISQANIVVVRGIAVRVRNLTERLAANDELCSG